MCSNVCVNNIGRIVIRDAECFWIFHKCLIFEKRCMCCCSPWFSYLGEKWQFVMEISGSGIMHLYLWRKFCRDLPNYKYTVQLKLNEENREYDSEHYCISYREGDLNREYGFQAQNFFPVNELKTDAIHCGLIKIYFVIKQMDNIAEVPLTSLEEKNNKDSISSEDETTSDEEDNEKKNVIFENKGVDRLVQNLKRLLQDEQSSDVLLKVEDREFKAHKAILKVRSPVFECMFQPNTKESISGVVDIPDVSASAFEVFLLYIYTGNTGTISSDNITDLYYAADKYEVNDLKSECVEFMEKNLSVDNFCEVMTLSLQHSESRLQKTATQFFCDNVKKIIKTVQWQKYLKDYSTQANELYIKAINA